MFSAPCVEIDELHWSSIGPGKDPDVLLESFIGVNKTAFRLLAFRVPMPYSAGWTEYASWEDDKIMHGDGLLWDVSAFRSFVQRVDAIPHDSRRNLVLETERVELDEAMAELEVLWRDLTVRLSWSGQRWRPAIIRGAPYIIIGYPTSAIEADIDIECELTMADARLWIPQPIHQHQFNLRIHGGVLGISCCNLRVLNLGDSSHRQTLNPDADGWMINTTEMLHQLPGFVDHVPFYVDGKAMAGYIAPVDVEAWSFHAARFAADMSAGLMDGRMRWHFDLPLLSIDDELARTMAALGRIIRERRLSRTMSGDVYLTCRLDEIERHLGLDQCRSESKLVDLLYSRLSRIIMRGLGRVADDPVIHMGHVIEKIYMMHDRVYVGPSAAFIKAAEYVKNDEWLHASNEKVVFETLVIDRPTEFPDWVNELPVMLDAPIRKLVADIEAIYEDA